MVSCGEAERSPSPSSRTPSTQDSKGTETGGGGAPMFRRAGFLQASPAKTLLGRETDAGVRPKVYIGVVSLGK